ncbi:9850_t:CDS:2, partial [Gigaspora margarita]
ADLLDKNRCGHKHKYGQLLFPIVSYVPDIENAFWTKGINDFILKEINTVIHIAIYFLYFISLGGVLLLLLPFLDKSVQKVYEDWSPIISFIINVSAIILSSYGYKRQIVDEKYNISSSPFFQAMIIFSVGRASHNILTQVLHRFSIKRYEKDLENLRQSSSIPINSYSIFQAHDDSSIGSSNHLLLNIPNYLFGSQFKIHEQCKWICRTTLIKRDN